MRTKHNEGKHTRYWKRAREEREVRAEGNRKGKRRREERRGAKREHGNNRNSNKVAG